MNDYPRLPEELLVTGSDGVSVGCPDCGPVAVPAAALTVVGDVETGAHHVTFACPACRTRTAQPVDVTFVAELVLAGAALRALTRAAEVDEADQVQDAPPLAEADVAAFVDALDRPGWENELFS